MKLPADPGVAPGAAAAAAVAAAAAARTQCLLVSCPALSAQTDACDDFGTYEPTVAEDEEDDEDDGRVDRSVAASRPTAGSLRPNVRRLAPWSDASEANHLEYSEPAVFESARPMGDDNG